ncbi:hypothetical protein CBS101457_005392 [Exobasidium rhododendri]|nr:hypothetical protein CBS101457_005392 [Exobasidium rhododendri]
MTSPEISQKSVPGKAATPATSTATATIKPSFNYAAAASSSAKLNASDSNNGSVAAAASGKGVTNTNNKDVNVSSSSTDISAKNTSRQSMSTTNSGTSSNSNNNSTQNNGSGSNKSGSNASATPILMDGVNGSARGISPVSMAKRSMASGNNPSINFGTPHDQDTLLSSSPAGPAQLGPNVPTKFGTVEADANVSKEKVAAIKGEASVRSLDLNKLFQGTPQTPTKSSNSSASLAPDAAANAGRNTPSNSSSSSILRANAGTQRPFEPQRTPSQVFHPMNAQSGAPGPRGPAAGAGPHSPYVSHQQQQQNPRSPHLGNQQNNMQSMPPMGGPPHWQGQQMYYGNMYQQPYGAYPGGMPQQQQQHHPHQLGQQWSPSPAGYDASQGPPRSPRHVPASPMGGGNPATPLQQPNGVPQGGASATTPSIGSTTPGISSPAASQRSIPHTPTTNPSSVASPNPQAQHQFGMGHPAGRNAMYHQASPSAAGYSHSPSPSFMGGMNPMSPSARQFEPAQKRMSSAIRIVNPETHAAIEVKAAKEVSSPAPATPTKVNASAVSTPILSAAASAAAAAPTASPSLPTKKSTAAVAPATGTQTPASSTNANAPAKIDTTESFMARVKAAAAESKKAKAEAAAAGLEKEAAEKRAKEEADRKALEEEKAKMAKAEEEEAAKKRKEEVEKEEKERAASEKKMAEEKEAAAAKAEAEEKERKARETAEKEEAAKAKADEARQAKEAEEQAAKKKQEEEEAKAVESAASQAKSTEVNEFERKPALPAPIDTSINLTESKSALEATSPSETVKSTVPPTTPNFRNSAADVERMAREASSVPSTPLDGRVPATPRTPGTPGFANLPARPNLNSFNSNAAVNGMKLDSDALEKKKRPVPSQLDLTAAAPQVAASTPSVSDNQPPMSAASAALESAKFINDLNKVSYPGKINSPKPELNESATPGRFRYDREFLMQFMGVYKEKPTDLPPLAQLGMDGSQAGGGRNVAGRRSSGMGPPSAIGRSGSQVGLGLAGGFGGNGAKAGGMGQFQHAPKTSEERFAQSNARGSVGAFGSSGAMGSFNPGARSQPLSRSGSGSNAIPTRDAMGTGVPSGGRAGSRRGRERGGGRDPNSRNQVNPPEKGGPTIPMDQVVPLQATENRWVGGRGAPKSEGPEMVTRKVKALLNKLTMERFDSISAQILEWANKSVNEKDGQTLRMVIALIFEKATDEAAWSEMYATLCRKILEELDPNIQDENLKTNDNKPVIGGHLFRKYLLNRCQEDFERGWAQRDSTAAAAKSKEAEDAAKKAEIDKAQEEAKEAEARGETKVEEKETELLSEEYYEAQKAKRRGLGLVRFIGELFKFAMLTEKIMHICIQRLLSNAQDPEEEEIESLCKLLTTVGKLLASGKASNYVDVYFQRIDDIMKNGAMNSRMKFMLQDVIDLRASGWIPRHDNSAPKTIAQIHEDAAKQKALADQETFNRQSRGGPLGGAMSRGGSRRGQPRDQYGPDGFITVGNQPAAPPHQVKAGNLSGFGKGIERSVSNRPLSVGPQSVFAKKNQRSDDGSNPPSRTASSQNIFSLLSSTNEGDAAQPSAQEESSGVRPKLNLAKRTKPLPSQEGAAGDEEKKGDEEEAGKDDEGDEEEEEDLTDEQAGKKIDNDIKEFLEIKDIEEATDALEVLPSKRRSEFINKIVETALNKKDEEVEMVGRFFTAAREKGLLDDETFEGGLKDQVEFLDDTAVDVPAAYKYMAILIVATGLSKEKIEALAETIQGEGLRSPKDRFMEKVNEQI